MKKKRAAATVQHEPDRRDLLDALTTMSDEVFGMFVSWALNGFPAGLGGFSPESRTSIEALRKAAADYADRVNPKEPA